MGQAYIDENCCIAWVDHQDCIVCERMCRVPEKAVVLDDTEVSSNGGDRVIAEPPFSVLLVLNLTASTAGPA